jgi:hypothetical protein
MKTIPSRSGDLRFGQCQANSLMIAAASCVLVAASAIADTKLVTGGAPVRILVPTDGSLGGTWRAPSFNDSSWLPGQNGVGYEVTPGVYNASVIADSAAEWSAGGRPGENSWINGYYDKSIDLDGTYQGSDFQPFPRSEGPFGPDNFWNGGAWAWFNGNPPWDTIGATDVHPNGSNQPQGIHWVIRRWHSTTAGAVTLRFHVRKSNLSGAGVTGKIFKNGAQIFTRAIAGGDGTGFEVFVNTTAAVGDVFDFAHTPEGPGGDDTDGADGSVMTATVLSGTVAPPLPPVQPVGVADSATDWSATGVQGANNWFYGYYNRTADADGTYDANTDFNTTDPNWTFSGGNWQLGVAGNPGANPPWDTIGQTTWHPNGDNQVQGIHWVIRRWVSEVDGDIYARVRFAKGNTSGNGTTLHVLHNGVDVYSVTLNTTAGVDVNVAFPGIFIGDKIDFALDPKGTDGLFGDGSDSSSFTASIFTGPAPVVPTAVADSVADWSATGVQGANGWTYGFYNETLDADHVYDPNADFNTTDPNWTFGGAWTLGPGDPPWDTIEQTNWHPNGDNNAEVHWVIKRWVSDVDGDLHANVQFGKQNINGGNGTTLRILRNGTQVFSRTVGGTDGTGFTADVNLPDVFVGDKIEFALDPLGTDGSKNDGADGSFLRASIITGLVAEPPKPFLPGIADTFTTDIETAMKGVNPSVFVRIPFNVANPALIETLKLKMNYNDGFVAYLNGTELVKRNTPTSIAGVTVADSIADWSTNPDVTVNGWSYGYYDQTLDSDRTYSGSSDFSAFPHDGLGYSPTDFWTGSGWDWFNGNPPWTELFQETTHPNHFNTNPEDPAVPGNHVQWTIRRWNATVDANLKCRVRFRKTNTGCGDGVRVDVFHNSVRVYSQTIAFNDGVGRDDTIELPDVFIGDNIDVLLGPGEGNDFCDGSAFSAVLFEGEPSIPWDGAATASRTTTQTIAPEVFDITAFKSELRTGANVLAIQGFNRTVNDNEFVVNAELLANRVPTAANDAVTASSDVSTTFPASLLLANDSDPDSDTLLLVGVTPTYTTTAGGAVRLFGDTVRYTPLAGFSGADSFEYTVTDVTGTPIRATVSVTVGTPNQAPVANNDSVTTAQDTPVAFNVLANDTDPDGDTLRVTGLSASPAHGILAIQFLTGETSYTPNAGYAGPDAFTYTVSDGRGGTSSATVSITVVPNTPPVANNDSVTTPQDTPVTFNVLVNDSDPNGDTLRVDGNAAAAHGTVIIQLLTGDVTYTPNAGYSGPDSFTYVVRDSRGATDSATVTITVTPANAAPVADASATALQVISPNGSNAVVHLDGTRSSDADGDDLTYGWFADGGLLPVALGAEATVIFELGTHPVTLRVDDGQAYDDDLIEIQVITAGEAVEDLILKVNQGNYDRKSKRALIASLKAAAASFDRGSFESGANQLEAFQNKVRAQVGKTDPALAAEWIALAQAIQDAVAGQ